MSTYPSLQTLMPLHETPVQALGAEDVRCVLADAYQAKAYLHRRYLAAAEAMEGQSLHVIAHAFRYTAAQEQEHEAVLLGILRVRGGEVPPAMADAPLPADPLLLLREAASVERDTADGLYPRYAAMACAVGEPRVAETFRRMAETERGHAQRFQQYAKALAEDTLFRDEQRRSWLCLACGQLHVSREAPAACPSCGCDQGHFIRSSYEPFLVEQ